MRMEICPHCKKALDLCECIAIGHSCLDNIATGQNNVAIGEICTAETAKGMKLAKERTYKEKQIWKILHLL